MGAWCCFIANKNRRCENEPKYEILAVRTTDLPAGPDPYADNTHACEQHVGALLGHQPDAIDVDEIYWVVRPIESL